MDWWILELFANALLVGVALWLGPLIKRFGKSYAADVFRANPRTGKSFIVLTDIAYYLIFFVLHPVHGELPAQGRLGRRRSTRPSSSTRWPGSAASC